MALSYFAPALNIVQSVASAYGLDSTTYLEAAGIDPARLDDSNARLRLDQVLDYFETLERALKEKSPAAGLAAHGFWHPSRFGPLGYAWLTSEHLHAAFLRLQRYSRIVSEGVRVELREEAGLLAVVADFVEPSRAPFLRMDTVMSLMLAMAQGHAGSRFLPERVVLAHAEPEDAHAYYALFRCPVIFDAPVCEFVIDAEAAQSPLRPSSVELERLHDQLVIDYLERLEGEDIVERTRAAIREVLPSGGVSDETVARRLNLSTRTLQRRLQNEGSSFKALLTEVRSELADQYLRDGRHSLSEIAFLLGFSELSAFSRAFRRWRGVSPSQYRSS